MSAHNFFKDIKSFFTGTPKETPCQVIQKEKVLLIGDINAKEGILSFCDSAPFGVDIKNIKSQQGINLQIWDTAGQERFQNITRSYYRGVTGIILVFDSSNKDSFSHTNGWMMDIRKNTDIDHVKIILLAKHSLDESRSISFEEGSEKAKKHGLDGYVEACCSDDSLQKAFDTLAEAIINPGFEYTAQRYRPCRLPQP